jgi:hypothetical protein
MWRKRLRAQDVAVMNAIMYVTSALDIKNKRQDEVT